MRNFTLVLINLKNYKLKYSKLVHLIFSLFLLTVSSFPALLKDMGVVQREKFLRGYLYNWLKEHTRKNNNVVLVSLLLTLNIFHTLL